jgi:hypothetical protein
LAVSEQVGRGRLAGDIVIKRESSAFDVGDRTARVTARLIAGRACRAAALERAGQEADGSCPRSAVLRVPVSAAVRSLGTDADADLWDRLRPNKTDCT